MKKNIQILFLLLTINTFSQNENQTSLEDKIYFEIYAKCFPQFKELPETKNRNRLNKIPFCTLHQCVRFIEYVEYEKKIQEAILKRALEITVSLYNQGTPIYLLSGMNSSDRALHNNINLKDDNKLVYINIAECVSSKTLEEIEKAVNNKTMELINKTN